MAVITWWSTWLAFIVVLAINGATGKQRCYICIPNTGLSIRDVLALFPSGPEIPLCNKFQPGRKEFIRDCPSDDTYMGCITATNGSHITKTCANVEVTDCQTANDVTYCYCTGDLCNAEPVPVEEARPAVDASAGSQPPDDEDDLSEGSGSQESYSSYPHLPTTHDEVTVDDTVQTSIGPENVTTTRPRNTAFIVISDTLLLFVSYVFVKIF